MADRSRGFLYVSPVRDSNKQYYVEPLGNHWFYYEAHYLVRNPRLIPMSG